MLDFEDSFSEFIDRREYDKAENALFSMVRISYLAGWLAAGGSPPQSKPVLKLCHNPLEKIPLTDCIETDISIDAHRQNYQDFSC
ncbi:MAG: hypothetical protein LUG13_00450 [Oscillospiraceae bacterium]|nr:hypothetical protein [Oscillospiraceae bacterium]